MKLDDQAVTADERTQLQSLAEIDLSPAQPSGVPKTDSRTNSAQRQYPLQSSEKKAQPASVYQSNQLTSVERADVQRQHSNMTPQQQHARNVHTTASH